MEVLTGLDAVSRIKGPYDLGIKKITRPFESKIKFEQWILFELGNIFNRTTVEISCKGDLLQITAYRVKMVVKNHVHARVTVPQFQCDAL